MCTCTMTAVVFTLANDSVHVGPQGNQRQLCMRRADVIQRSAAAGDEILSISESTALTSAA